MRIVICDDNPVILDQLRGYIESYFSQIGGAQPEYEVYTSGEALLANVSSADIAFLDVEMPGLSGIHVGAKLKAVNPYIKIFIVTSYPDYLDEAMRFQVFRYLSKPIDKNRLYRNLKDALYQYSIESVEYPISTESGIEIRRSDEIVCVETFQRKVAIHTLTETIISNNTIDYWRSTLTLPCFCSPHRSYIINMRYVSSIYKDKVILKFGEKQKEAYLARRKYTLFKNTYLLYRESMK